MRIRMSGAVLTGVGIAGMLTAAVLAVRATPKALKLLDEERDNNGELTRKQAFKTVWKLYIPAAGTFMLSAASLIFAQSVTMRKNAALMTAYEMSESAFKDYREQVVKAVGEKKEREIEGECEKMKLERTPLADDSQIFVTGRGDTWCFDYISGRYFMSSPDDIRRAVLYIERLLVDGDNPSLNDFYDEIGLERIEIGDYLGWNSNNMHNRGLEASFGSHLSKADKPCLVVRFNNDPVYDYERY